MTDRQRPHADTTRPPVRRNLFQTHLSRRPTTHSAPPSTTDIPRLASAQERAAHATTQAHLVNQLQMSTTMYTRRPYQTHSPSASSHPSLDIVMRDHNGEFAKVDPDLPPGDAEGADDEDEGAADLEAARERQRLADAVRMHQRDRNRAPSEPVELLEAVTASLRAKTAALADDNWMYEAEEDFQPR